MSSRMVSSIDFDYPDHPRGLVKGILISTSHKRNLNHLQLSEDGTSKRVIFLISITSDVQVFFFATTICLQTFISATWHRSSVIAANNQHGSSMVPSSSEKLGFCWIGQTCSKTPASSGRTADGWSLVRLPPRPADSEPWPLVSCSLPSEAVDVFLSLRSEPSLSPYKPNSNRL